MSVGPALSYPIYIFGANSGYFTTEAQTKPLLHTWSLAVEEQYYVFAPLAFYLVYQFGGRKWLLFFAPLMLLSLGTSVLAVFVGPTAGFFLLPTRIRGLLLGAAGAFVRRAPGTRSWHGEWMAAIGLGLILLGVFALDDLDPFPGWNALIPCIGTALIIQAAIGRGADAPRVNRLLASAPLVGVGAISYSLYLVHWPIAAFTRYLPLRDPTLAEAGLMMGASFVLAWISLAVHRAAVSSHRSWLSVEGLIGRRCRNCRRRLRGQPGHSPKGLAATLPGSGRTSDSGKEDWGGDQCFNQNPASASLWGPPGLHAHQWLERADLTLGRLLCRAIHARHPP